MPDNWETYRDCKKLMEDIRRKPQEDTSYDDNVEDLVEQFKEYLD